MTALTCALKEWAIAVEALLQGELILLLRKGGIRETGGKFQVQCNRVALFPTVEHQKSAWLKPAYQGQVTESTARPDTITFAGWAEINEVIPVTDPEIVAQLTPFHIWTEAWAAERFAWKPKQPLLALLLRAYRFATPHTVEYQQHFGGCRSWLDLAPPLDATGSQAVLSDRAYREQVAAIQAILSPAD